MAGEPTSAWDEGALRALVPQVLAGLVRRGEQFDAAEDALQEALLEALTAWACGHQRKGPEGSVTTCRRQSQIVTVAIVVGISGLGLPSSSAKPSSKRRRLGGSASSIRHRPWYFSPSGPVMK